MRAEILSIGDEILSGKTVNTNATTIAKHLIEEGFLIEKVTVLSDKKESLKQELIQALERSSFVITTGGLGPTGDDVTREVVAEVFDAPLCFSQEVSQDLVERYGEDFPTIHDQSMIPSKAQVIKNPIGTAPGLILSKENATLFVLPGVPSQMEALLKKGVIPYLKAQDARTSRVFQKSFYLCMLSEVQVDPFLREIEKKYSDLSISICPSYGYLSVHVRGFFSNQEKAQHCFQEIKEMLLSQFSSYLYSEASPLIEEALHKIFIEKGKTFACAESCTGGKIAYRITSMAGASEYFMGSVVSYSNLLKESALGVKRDTLRHDGAVSQETVLEMVRGVSRLTDADYTMAVSGIAGPSGGSLEKPVGTIWAAIGEKGKSPYVGSFLAKGTGKRSLVIHYSTTVLLSALWRLIQHHKAPFQKS